MVQDFSLGINKYLCRAAMPIPAPWQVWQSGSLCSASYYQIPIIKESQPYTTFMTEHGCFAMTRLAMGLSASSDAFNHKVGEVFDEYPNLRLAREIDDLLIHTTDMQDLDSQLELLLSICRQRHLTLSPKKFQLALPNQILNFRRI